MPMSIRSAEVENLARKLSAQTGYSMTETIERALEAMDSSRAEDARARYSRIADLAARCSALPDRDTRSEAAILGYGEDGLTDSGTGAEAGALL